MAVTDAYATAEEYRARVTKADVADDADVLEQLTAVSRLIDARCRRFFTKDATVQARLYDGNGKSVIKVDDIATATGLIVKCDLNGDYDVTDSNETLTIDVDFWLGPAAAVFGSEPRPYYWLEVVPTSTKLSVWPNQKRAIQVTATYGWATPPGAIKEAVIAVTREIRDMQEAGYSLNLQTIDAAIQSAPQASFILQDIVNRYGLHSGV